MENIDMGFLVAAILAVVVVFVIFKTAVVVPQQNAFVVENLGKYSRTLRPGFNILIPFIERVAYRHSLKENALDIQEQICITRDNVQVGVDGVLYLQVMNAERASYGIGDYIFAISQLAQTTLRSEIGKIELDKTFEERTAINLSVVEELDKASNGRSAPSSSPPRASGTRRSTRPKARRNASYSSPKRRCSSRSTKPRARPKPSWPSPRPPHRA
jgi:regulator of protease activity HflC (stomatin/prohibitin superfamily)